MRNLIIILFLAVLFTSCKKEKEEDAISPSVTISSPANDAHAPGGQEITVTAAVVDDIWIEEVHFHVTNKATGEELVHEHYQPGAKTYNFSGAFTVQSGIVYHIEVKAEDKTGNAAEDEIEITGD